MEKRKTEKIILLIILPIFVVALALKFVGKAKEGSVTHEVISPDRVAEDYTGREAAALTQLKSTLKEIKYKADSALDPLMDKLSAYLASVVPVAKKEILDIKPPQLKITGLIWNTDRPQAIVNERVLSAGDEIEGAKLLSVTKNGINIEYKGVKFFIEK